MVGHFARRIQTLAIAAVIGAAQLVTAAPVAAVDPVGGERPDPSSVSGPAKGDGSSSLLLEGGIGTQSLADGLTPEDLANRICQAMSGIP